MEDALHEDRVLVKVIRKRYPPKTSLRGRRIRQVEEKERIEGTVVRVLERKHSRIVGGIAHTRASLLWCLWIRGSFTMSGFPIRRARGERRADRRGHHHSASGRNQIPQGKIDDILGYPGDPGIEYKIVEISSACL